FLLSFLIEPALPEDTRVRFRGLSLISPGSTLDALADVQVPGEAGPVPLLTYVPGDLEATGEQAERSEARRRVLEAQLTASTTKEVRAQWLKALEAVRDPLAERRGHGFATLAALSARRPPGDDAALRAWWAHAVRVEPDRVERARHTLLELARATVKPSDALGGSTADRVAVRQALFEDPEALAD